MFWVTSGFILDGQEKCFANSTCICSGYDIKCDNKSLMAMPRFILENSTQAKFSGFRQIELQNNAITQIQNNAFKNLTGIRTILLDNNNISYIHENAFSGIETTVRKLSLENNNLSNVPLALGKLKNLLELNLLGNPISNFENVMAPFFGLWSMNDLKIDMSHFLSWPFPWNNTYSFYSKIYYLTIDMIPFNTLPLNAFVGIENKIHSLKITHSRLLRIPSAICSLQNMKSFSLDNNAFLESNISLSKSCGNKSSLSEITLRNNGLTNFPDILIAFTSLTGLYIDYNKIRFIPSHLIPYSNRIENLILSNNELYSIPSAINRMTHIKTLMLDHNRIITIENNDFVGLTNLNSLYVGNNPLQFVEFPNNLAASTISLSHANLTSIPAAISRLPNLHHLYIQHNAIRCTCSNLSNMKGWSAIKEQYYDLEGNCEKQENDIYSLLRYMRNVLPNCP